MSENESNSTSRRSRNRNQQKQVEPKETGAELGVFKMYGDSPDPVWATNGSACFDLKAYLPIGTDVLTYTEGNTNVTKQSRFEIAQDKVGITLQPSQRALIPTGLIFDIPEGYSIRVHPRSGLSLKQGITLTNCEGVIDSDYVEQTYISITNISKVNVFITNGDRIAQAELVESLPSNSINIKTLDSKPKQKTTRKGGFGHTGV